MKRIGASMPTDDVHVVFKRDIDESGAAEAVQEKLKASYSHISTCVLPSICYTNQDETIPCRPGE
ncbi:MAG: hypothetical protein Q4A34_02935 [Candidatus Saccharibacteria bacterium]|nr:hypothetical protein [Candidatus Saccharibacteria bacterium]